MLGLIFMMMTWNISTLPDYHRPTGTPPPYLNSQEGQRWEHLRQCRLLYHGAHARFFLDEDRTQFRYRDEEVQSRIIRRYITVNLLKLLSHTTADLLFGAKPKIEATTPEQTDAIDELSRRCLLNAKLHECAVQASWAGGGFLEISMWKNEVYIEVVSADEIFPQGAIQPDGQYAAYVRYATDTAGPADKPTRLLLITRYQAGLVQRRLYQLTDTGAKGEEIQDLSQWPAFQAAAPAADQATGIDGCTIVYVPNKVGDRVGVSDYDDLIGLQDTVNAKRAQLARILEMNLDPKMWFPDANTGGPDGNVRARDHAFYGGDKPPEYITWQAQVEGARADLTGAMLEFCAAAEMSPVLLGIRQGATPDAARKLRLEATKDLSRTARKALVMEPAIALAIELALKLDQATPLLPSYPMDPVGVHVQDGLPVDPLDRATEASSWASTNSISLEDLVAMRVEDPDAQAIEVDRVRKQRAEATPSIFLGANHNGEPGAETNPQDQGASAA